MNIAIGCDHRGTDLKQYLISYLNSAGCSCRDFGAFTTESIDYPDVAFPLSKAVAKGEFDYGILICNTGIGMSIAANKVTGIRAALCHNSFYAERARLHNDANVLCLGTITGNEISRDIVNTFITTQFEGGRHARRLDKIKAREDKG